MREILVCFNSDIVTAIHFWHPMQTPIMLITCSIIKNPREILSILVWIICTFTSYQHYVDMDHIHKNIWIYSQTLIENAMTGVTNLRLLVINAIFLYCYATTNHFFFLFNLFKKLYMCIQAYQESTVELSFLVYHSINLAK